MPEIKTVRGIEKRKVVNMQSDETSRVIGLFNEA
jgi:hypothetical protein